MLIANETRPILTTAEAARALGVHRETVAHMARDGRLRAQAVDRAFTVVSRDSVTDLLADRIGRKEAERRVAAVVSGQEK